MKIPVSSQLGKVACTSSLEIINKMLLKTFYPIKITRA